MNRLSISLAVFAALSLLAALGVSALRGVMATAPRFKPNRTWGGNFRLSDVAGCALRLRSSSGGVGP